MGFGTIGASAVGTGTSVSVPVPADIAADTVVIISGYVEVADTITWPAGFVQISDNSSGVGSSRGRHLVAMKRATGSESGTYAVSWTNSSVYDFASFTLTGRATLVATSALVDNSALNANTSATVLTSTVPSSGNLAVGGVGTQDLIFIGSNHATDAGVWTAPTGMTKRYDNSGSGVAHLAIFTQDSVAQASYSKVATGTGATGGSTLKGTLIAVASDDTVKLVGTTSTNPGSVSTATPALPSGYKDGDRFIAAVGMRPDTSSIPDAPSGWIYIGSDAGGSASAAGNDAGPVALAFYQRDATSTSETAPTFNAGATAPSAWVINIGCFRPGSGKVWAANSEVQTAKDSTTGTITSGTTPTFTRHPTTGDGIACWFVGPGGANMAGTWNFSVSATGLTAEGGGHGPSGSTLKWANTSHGPGGQYNFNWLGNFYGTESAGVTFSSNHASIGGEYGTGVLGAVSLIQGAPVAQKAGWGLLVA